MPGLSQDETVARIRWKGSDMAFVQHDVVEIKLAPRLPTPAVVVFAVHAHVFNKMARVLRPLPVRKALLWSISRPAFWLPEFMAGKPPKPQIRWKTA